MKSKKTIIIIIPIVVVIAITVFALIKFDILKNKEIEYFLDVNLTEEQIQQYEERKAQNFESLELFPSNYNVYMDLGNIERELGNASKAIEYFTKAWEIIPTNSTPWLNIGNNLAKLYDKFLIEKVDEVRGVYLEGLIKTNNDYQLLDFFTGYLIKEENYSEALQYLNVLLKDVNADHQSVINKIQEVETLMEQDSQ